MGSAASSIWCGVNNEEALRVISTRLARLTTRLAPLRDAYPKSRCSFQLLKAICYLGVLFDSLPFKKSPCKFPHNGKSRTVQRYFQLREPRCQLAEKALPGRVAPALFFKLHPRKRSLTSSSAWITRVKSRAGLLIGLGVDDWDCKATPEWQNTRPDQCRIKPLEG